MTRSSIFALALTLALPATAGQLPTADTVFPVPDMAEVRLGQLLFYDPILSGSREVACATCHNPRFGTSDGLSLGLGDGAHGLGPERTADPANYPEKRVARNAPGLFNLGAPEFTRMFHDGRLEADPDKPGGIRTPLGEDMAAGFNSVLSAQAMFPVLAPDEMAGHYSESDVSKVVRKGFFTEPGGAWDLISKRVEAIPAYRAAFDGIIGDRPVRFTDIANAIAAFTEFEWRADDAPFDRYLKDGTPMAAQQMAGMDLFYGKAGCADCHSGRFQTDNEFHAIAMPQIGPGKVERFETGHQDEGRFRVTGNPADLYAFRTPSLRNVTATAPYGHDGAYARLEDVVRHHLDPVGSLMRYDLTQAVLPHLDEPEGMEGMMDFPVMADAAELDEIAKANQLSPVDLSDAEVDDLLAFLGALTDPTSLAGRLGVPESVPSGLPVDR